MEQVVILPIGSFEQHGKLLPHDTDSIICVHIARLVADRVSNSVLLPSLNYGISAEHLGLGRTLTLQLSTYTTLLQDMLYAIKDAYYDFDLIVLSVVVYDEAQDSGSTNL